MLAIAKECGTGTRPLNSKRSLRQLWPIFLALIFISLPAAGKEIGKGFFVNIYLTQAWGITDGVPIFGLDDEGRFDYRSAALLLRFNISDSDSLVFQLDHEDLGNSPTNELRDEVGLDWAFYQKTFGDSRIRVGRLPIPFGIYNELRDLGTDLEFFRPPVGIYNEGSYTSETLDGASLSHTFFSDSEWSLNLGLYAGSWDRAEFARGLVFPGKAKDGLGSQLWLETPVPGLRFGAAWQTYNQEGAEGILRIGKTRHSLFLFSADADFDRFFARAEFSLTETSFLTQDSIDSTAYYLLAGIRATDKLSFHVLWEDSLVKGSGTSFFPPARFDPFYQDLALSVGYRFSPNGLLRVEAHHAKSFLADTVLPPDQPFFDVDYGLVSLAVAF